MNSDLQKICAWTGIPAVTVFFIGMAIMTFIPPLSPALSAEEVAHTYQTHTALIRTGAVIVAISSIFAVMFYASISMQIRAMEGSKRPIMAYAQLIAGAANIQFFILPALLWIVAAFRPDRPIEITYALNDLAWIIAIDPWPITFIQMLICGLAILKHASTSPVFPRWVGFFNLWGALVFIPGSLLPFFKTGPFAWNGLLSFWLPGSIFGVWFIVMQIMMLKAIKGEQIANP